MFEKGSYVIYKRDVCKIADIFKSKVNNMEYYRLSPISDESLIINVPTDNKNGYLKRLLTKEEIEKLIDNIPNIMPVEADSHLLDNIYKELFHSGNHEDLIKIIKTSYLRNKHRKEAKRSIGQKDDEYFKKAEKYLYNEFSVVLGLDFDETKKYVIDKVKENVKD